MVYYPTSNRVFSIRFSGSAITFDIAESNERIGEDNTMTDWKNLPKSRSCLPHETIFFLRDELRIPVQRNPSPDRGTFTRVQTKLSGNMSTGLPFKEAYYLIKIIADRPHSQLGFIFFPQDDKEVPLIVTHIDPDNLTRWVEHSGLPAYAVARLEFSRVEEVRQTARIIEFWSIT